MSEGDERGRVMTDEERARAVREQLKSLHAFDLAYEMMVSLVTFGYQKLGLTTETAELRDLDDAHYAIELLGAILKVSDRLHPVPDLRDLHSTLAQMQLGYVQALELEGPRPEPPAEPTTAAAPEPPAEAAAEQILEEPPEPPVAQAPPAEGAPESAAAGQAEAKEPAKPDGKKIAKRKPAAEKKPEAKKKPAPEKKPARKRPAPKADDAG